MAAARAPIGSSHHRVRSVIAAFKSQTEVCATSVGIGNGELGLAAFVGLTFRYLRYSWPIALATGNDSQARPAVGENNFDEGFSIWNDGPDHRSFRIGAHHVLDRYPRQSSMRSVLTRENSRTFEVTRIKPSPSAAPAINAS